MDISKDEQRVLHALAKGGRIEAAKTSSGRITGLDVFTREGWTMPGVSVRIFRKLKRKRAVASRQGGPYRITRRGLELVRSQPDNR
ncbi:MAG: YjhX family toxin [Pseudomonadota bacterium]